MTGTERENDVRLPFGRHKGKPLPDVPVGYLRWAISTCKLSTGLLTALSEELSRRGIKAPAPRPCAPIPRCVRCGPDAGAYFRWLEDSAGRRRIRSECKQFRRWLGFAPLKSPYVEEADAAAIPLPVLHVMTQLETLGVELASDGRKCWLPGDAWKRVPPELRSQIRQCSHTLARMIGNNLDRQPRMIRRMMT
jgi:hypothetical protein